MTALSPLTLGGLVETWAGPIARDFHRIVRDIRANVKTTRIVDCPDCDMGSSITFVYQPTDNTLSDESVIDIARQLVVARLKKTFVQAQHIREQYLQAVAAGEYDVPPELSEKPWWKFW